MGSWIPVPPESDFSLDNLPFGIFSRRLEVNSKPRVGVAIGDVVVDLGVMSMHKLFQDLTGLGPEAEILFQSPTLNGFASKGKPFHSMIRRALREMLSEHPSEAYKFLRDDLLLHRDAIVNKNDVVMHLPMEIGDYTDFYAGVHHATNVGSLFRDPKNPLPLNYRTLPIAYHGRASSVVVSGTPVARPRGQILAPLAANSIPIVQVSPSRKLDFELEIGFFICRPNNMGESVNVNDAYDHIFGYVLLNDWSARDIQSYEYVPLGPFSGKNFATSISPWVVLTEALEPFHRPVACRSDCTFPYLDDMQLKMFDMHLEVDLALPGKKPQNVTRVSSNNMIWSFPQMVAQHTLSGCPLRTGDLFGTGTISGTSSSEYGSLLEQSKNGTEPIQLDGGITRTFLLDGDTVTLRGYGINPVTGVRVGFGECTGTVRPAHSTV